MMANGHVSFCRLLPLLLGTAASGALVTVDFTGGLGYPNQVGSFYQQWFTAQHLLFHNSGGPGWPYTDGCGATFDSGAGAPPFQFLFSGLATSFAVDAFIQVPGSAFWEMRAFDSSNTQVAYDSASLSAGATTWLPTQLSVSYLPGIARIEIGFTRKIGLDTLRFEGTFAPPPGSAVPLPGAAGLAAYGLLGVSRRRRR